MILIDIDNFKTVNDTHGHSEGDIVLAEVGRIIEDTVPRGSGFRMGGDEFLCLLVQTELKSAELLAHRIQNAIIEHPWISRESKQTYSIGASIGVAIIEDTAMSLEDLFKLADSKMYEGKRKARAKSYLQPKKTASASVGGQQLRRHRKTEWIMTDCFPKD